jgi:hypothetical protein
MIGVFLARRRGSGGLSHMAIGDIGLSLRCLFVSMLFSGHAQSQSYPIGGGQNTAGSGNAFYVPDRFGHVTGTYVGTRVMTAVPGQAAKGVASKAAPDAIAVSRWSEVDDGFSNAPICAIQHPALLKGYRVRPNWHVAGVDYCVGHATNIVLKGPSTISMPGVSVNTSSKTINVIGNNVTLDGYDFSLNGGWNVKVEAANTRIINSKFLVGANNNVPIDSTATASNLYIGYCIIDGNGKDVGMGGLITDLGTGLTVEYCWIKNSGGDMIQKHGQGGNMVLRYNLLEQGGLQPGAHGDYTQILNGPSTATIVFNTGVQKGGSTQGFMTEYLTSGEIGNNVMIGTASYWTSVDISSIISQVTVHDNYFDSQGFGFVYPNS